MSTIQDEIDAFERMQSQLEAEHLGRWVLIFGRKLIRVYESFESAANDAVDQFGSGPFLIRQVGAPPITLPVSVMYHRPDAER
jgi:hypothetical protein